ncbi:hypothetical protein [Bordetella petrii]|uniref:Uncharacterized protein n=1 Tax=Bordetella petrii (strain ATCC BAA-461 / DSM 12804 / CCUG 43448 / CIP 107267 / Se-1111R) TaxID=340100 RepID=A9ID27_BORPD|nr:hypothetical protein [Bordetella petrii]CAP44752.1 hypothetical protein Bpet4401 [Bordetella petrii]
MLKLIATGMGKLLGNTTTLALLVAVGIWLWHLWAVSGLEDDLALAQTEATAARTDADKAASERDQWRGTAEQRARDLAALADERRQVEAATVALQNKLAKHEDTYRTVRESIRAAPDADDGAVAPVLRRTIEALP